MMIENERFEESQTPAPDIHNPVELIVRAAGVRFGAPGGTPGGANGMGAGQGSGSSGLVPDFETGVDEDGNDTDMMIWGEDNWGDPLRHWTEV